MARILVIDAQGGFRNSLCDKLAYEGHEVSAAENVTDEEVGRSPQPYDVVICDYVRFWADDEVLEHFPRRTAIMVVSADPDAKRAEECIGRGARDCFAKPIDFTRLREAICKAVETAEAVVDEARPAERPPLRAPQTRFAEEIVGRSPSTTKLRYLIDKIAPTDAKVLIMGENGTGKELVARWLHEKSNRRGMPFVEVNCAAIPGDLIESELFGHEKGAFTSAVKCRKGKFEQADGGTIFLDEIGDMSLAAQAKVLRTLQEHKIYRVGSEKEVGVNVRVVAATNKDLYAEMGKGLFREDLFHRLSVIVINVPSLNERTEDIPLLVNHFNVRICEQYGVEPRVVEEAAMKRLCTMHWGGNIRQLRNVIERLVILSGNCITLNDVIAYADYFPVARPRIKEYEVRH
ncbi:MAG: sigma-54 dependent transcriptional regulator [Rikenellaceae bacterium]|jgi:DNA-binding NtrC family response regulator|nr:sigma-54 dependent transcriptional regulator [Rikenellaceae bacterium]